MFMFDSYDENGHSKGKVRYEDLPDPVRLKWELNSKVNLVFFS